MHTKTHFCKRFYSNISFESLHALWFEWLVVLHYWNCVKRTWKSKFSTQYNLEIPSLCQMIIGLIVEIQHANHILPSCFQVSFRYDNDDDDFLQTGRLKSVKSFSRPGLLSEVITIVSLWLATSTIWTCAEPEFSFLLCRVIYNKNK